MKIVAIGEILWDVFDHGERLGGAPFNFAAHARRLGHDVFFVSAVGDDDRGRRALERACSLGLSTRFIRTVPSPPTGVVTVTVDAQGQPSYVIHRPAAYDEAALSDADLAELGDPAPDWIAFGTLHQMNPNARRLTARLLEAFPKARRFYDVNLRAASYTPELVSDLLSKASLVKLNEHELAELAPALNPNWEGLCVTRGERGAWIVWRGESVDAPACKVTVVDAVGAGDAFSAALVHGLGAGWPLAEVADFANRLGAYVAGRPGAIPDE